MGKTNKQKPEQLPLSGNEILFNTVNVHTRISSKRELRKWLTSVALNEKKRIGAISYNLCSDGYLLKINKQYLQHFDYTDIITFDLSQGQEVSGDIYISSDRVKENARAFQVTLAEELARVMVHGLLHLCGYKDKSAKQKEIMRQKEDYYLYLHTISMFSRENMI